MSSRSHGGIRSQPAEVLDHCAQALERGDLCLVLGSGASQDAGLPTWKDLAEKFAERVDGGGPHPRSLYGDQATWVIECVRGSLDEAKYRDHLQIALYGTEAFELDPRTFKHLAVYPLARLAVASRRRQQDRGSDWREVSGVRQGARTHHAFDVLTYNLDCLLEFAIRKLGYRSDAIVPRIGLDEPSHRFEFGPERVPWSRPVVRVFHPHGVLPPGERNNRDPALLNTLPLVMSAEDYEVRGGSADIWQNSLQLAAFTQRSCLFYGFSFADPSVRQLLRLAGRLRSNESAGGMKRGHVAFLREPRSREIPTRDHWEAALQQFGFSHVFWSDPSAEVGFRDQISMLDRLCQAVGAPSLRSGAG